MRIASESKTFDEGREQQFEVMMERIAALQARYQGVRGELLAKVWAELLQLRPSRAKAVPAAAAPAKVLPSCRQCGRAMTPNGTDGTLVCERGHTRVVA